MTALPRGVIAVIRTGDAEHARTLVRGLLAGGVPGVEVTLTVPRAVEIIAEFAAEADGRLGAGTVRTEDDVVNCGAAGAAYLVSPVFDHRVLDRARLLELPMIPGVLTPTEMSAAQDAGAAGVKVFPASTMGGAGYLRAVLEPMPELRIVASGGIELGQVADYLAVGAYAVCLGTALSDPAAVAAGDWESVAETVQRRLAGLPQPVTSAG